MTSASRFGPLTLPTGDDGLPHAHPAAADAPAMPVAHDSPVPCWLSQALVVWMQEPGEDTPPAPERKPH